MLVIVGGVNLAHKLRAKFAYDVRHVAGHHANVSRTCRKERARGDVTFGPLCTIQALWFL
jgi:hypothetical protein